MSAVVAGGVFETDQQSDSGRVEEGELTEVTADHGVRLDRAVQPDGDRRRADQVEFSVQRNAPLAADLTIVASGRAFRDGQRGTGCRVRIAQQGKA